VDSANKRQPLLWIGLCCILAVYLVFVFRFNPVDLFGRTHDDSLYFSFARAIANHQGYILPSVPGGPAATKYPILYPWILSWVWRWNPSFPSNLIGAVVLTAAFGVIFLTSTFLFLRRLKGIGDNAALLLTLLIALHPVVLFLSASVLSDIPFAALALAAMLTADRTMRPNASAAETAGCALLTGLAALLRIFGVPVAAGILAAAVARRAWRQIAVFSAVLVPFGCVIAWPLLFARRMVPPGLDGAALEPGFVGAWTYYTSYLGFWKLSVPNAHILWAMLKDNAILILRAPSNYFLAPLLTNGSIASTALMLLVTVAIVAGVLRLSRNHDRDSLYWTISFYAALILIWNYPLTDRFCIPFLPLFAGALWLEAKQSLKNLYATITKNPLRSQRTAAGILFLGAVALICGLAWNYAFGARATLAKIAGNRSRILPEKREAYEWLSCCTSREVVVIAYEDAALYLYSGRQGMRPVAFPTSGAFDEMYIRDAVAHLTDVGRALGARYWLIADDDFGMESESAISLGRARETELAQRLPMVFQSRNGHVRIYKIGCDAASNYLPCP
jgi:hypothetical protein